MDCNICRILHVKPLLVLNRCYCKNITLFTVTRTRPSSSFTFQYLSASFHFLSTQETIIFKIILIFQKEIIPIWGIKK